MLNEEQIEKLKLTMSTSGWREVVEPVIRGRGQEAVEALIHTPSERKGEWTGCVDDKIRARIDECKWMLSFWQNQINAYEHNRRLDEQAIQDGANPQ